jgi:hypothetical protein
VVGTSALTVLVGCSTGSVTVGSAVGAGTVIVGICIIIACTVPATSVASRSPSGVGVASEPSGKLQADKTTAPIITNAKVNLFFIFTSNCLAILLLKNYSQDLYIILILTDNWEVEMKKTGKMPVFFLLGW